jgi:hypothetical protein
MNFANIEKNRKRSRILSETKDIITCEGYIDYEHSYQHQEKGTSHYLYQDLTEGGTHSGHLSVQYKVYFQS